MASDWLFLVDVANEGLIDLDLVEREALQITERRVAVPKSSMEMRTPTPAARAASQVFSRYR